MILRESVRLGQGGVSSWTGNGEWKEPRRTPARRERGTVRAGFAEPDFRKNPETQAGTRQSRKKGSVWKASCQGKGMSEGLD